jgi:hypothetical protein
MPESALKCPESGCKHLQAAHTPEAGCTAHKGVQGSSTGHVWVGHACGCTRVFR